MTDEDWEEWDGSSPFWVHCVAGSLAGVVEHTAVYPLDTVRTHIQVCASCLQRPKPRLQARTLPTGMWQTIRYLMNESAAATLKHNPQLPTTATPNSLEVLPAGWRRLWRGVPTILLGCIPAHALYFSSYELVKASTLDSSGHVTTYGSLAAGAAATTMHDLVMTPLDTLKQRMQLGHYESVTVGLRSVWQGEGFKALYRSFPVTLASNIPYGMLMVSTHETCKALWTPPEATHSSWQVILLSSSVAGFVASALTTPLDRIKTALQTQQLAPTCWKQDHCTRVHYHSWSDAARHIWQTEGLHGFARGLTPRVLAHTPAVAISWTTYETAKEYLMPREWYYE